MKLYKKSQSEGRHVILLVILLLVALAVMLIIIWQSEGAMSAYLNKLF